MREQEQGLHRGQGVAGDVRADYDKAQRFGETEENVNSEFTKIYLTKVIVYDNIYMYEAYHTIGGRDGMAG